MTLHHIPPIHRDGLPPTREHASSSTRERAVPDVRHSHAPQPPTPPAPPRRRFTDTAGWGLMVLAVVLLAAAIASQRDSSSGRATAAAPAPAAAAATEAVSGYDALPDAEPGTYDMTAHRYDPATKPVAAGAKTFELTTAEHKVRIGDKVYDQWTINGTVPGPVLRAVVGDRVTVRIHNASASTMFHSVDFHASRMSMGGGDVQVAPGKTGTFTFTAEYPGVFMYHCATAPVLDHLQRGMYGMLIVQPKEGFGAPMPEYAILQSELYANLDDATSGTPANVVFNGIPNQYADEPIVQKPGDRVRVFVLNAGPNLVSSFHVVGTVFDRVLADGNPANVTVGTQVIGLPASGGAVAEMQLVGTGKFPIVTHQFNHASAGAVGAFVTGGGGHAAHMQH